MTAVWQGLKAAWKALKNAWNDHKDALRSDVYNTLAPSLGQSIADKSASNINRKDKIQKQIDEILASDRADADAIAKLQRLVNEALTYYQSFSGSNYDPNIGDELRKNYRKAKQAYLDAESNLSKAQNRYNSNSMARSNALNLATQTLSNPNQIDERDAQRNFDIIQDSINGINQNKIETEVK